MLLTAPPFLYLHDEITVIPFSTFPCVGLCPIPAFLPPSTAAEHLLQLRRTSNNGSGTRSSNGVACDTSALL